MPAREPARRSRIKLGIPFGDRARRLGEKLKARLRTRAQPVVSRLGETRTLKSKGEPSTFKSRSWTVLSEEPLVIKGRQGDIATVTQLVDSAMEFIGDRNYAEGYAELERVGAIYGYKRLPSAVKELIQVRFKHMASSLVESPATLRTLPQIAHNFMVQLARDVKRSK